MPSASSSNSGFHSFILLCFGCWVLVLVVFLMTSPSASKTVLLWQTSCVFGGGNIAGSTMRKVPHLAMCGDFALFMGCNISTFCSPVLVAIFPTKLVSPHSEFICKSYSGFSLAVLNRIIGAGYFVPPEFPVPQLVQEIG